MKNKILFSLGLGAVFFLVSRQIVFGMWDPYVGASTNLPDASIYYIIENILSWLLDIIGIVGVIAFIISGLMYLTSAGDEKRIATAKNAMTNAVIGVIVAIIGVVVLQAVDMILNGYGF